MLATRSTRLSTKFLLYRKAFIVSGNRQIFFQVPI